MNKNKKIWIIKNNRKQPKVTDKNHKEIKILIKIIIPVFIELKIIKLIFLQIYKNIVMTTLNDLKIYKKMDLNILIIKIFNQITKVKKYSS